MDLEPDNNRNAANYRFYCDDDIQDPDGHSRWRLRADPLPPHCFECTAPIYFTPNHERPRWEDAPARLAQHGYYQEWEDLGEFLARSTYYWTWSMAMIINRVSCGC